MSNSDSELEHGRGTTTVPLTNNSSGASAVEVPEFEPRSVVFTAPQFGELAEEVNAHRRFNYTVSPVQRERQFRDEAKLLKDVKWPQWTGATEEDFEAYLDQFSLEMLKHRLHFEIVKRGWVDHVPARVAWVIQRSEAKSYEQLADEIAKDLYIDEDYVGRLELELLNGHKCPTAVAAVRELSDKLNRYARLCQRWDRPSVVSDRNVVDTLWRYLPNEVVTELKKLTVQKTWRVTSREAERLDRIRQQAHADDVFAEDITPVRTAKLNLPGELDPDLLVRLVQREQRRQEAYEASKAANLCYFCSQRGHFKADCPERLRVHCANCGAVGAHHPHHCPKTISRDPITGQPMTTLTHTGGSATFTAHRPVTTAQRAAAASALTTNVARTLVSRSEKGKQRRQGRRDQGGGMEEPAEVAAAQSAAL